MILNNSYFTFIIAKFSALKDSIIRTILPLGILEVKRAVMLSLAKFLTEAIVLYPCILKNGRADPQLISFNHPSIRIFYSVVNN